MKFATEGYLLPSKRMVSMMHSNDDSDEQSLLETTESLTGSESGDSDFSEADNGHFDRNLEGPWLRHQFEDICDVLALRTTRPLSIVELEELMDDVLSGLTTQDPLFAPIISLLRSVPTWDSDRSFALFRLLAITHAGNLSEAYARARGDAAASSLMPKWE